MKYTKLGRTGLDVSPICLGCMSYGASDRGTHSWTLDEETSRGFIRQALDAGINFFDTANVYSDGTSEEYGGRALADMAKREEIVLATYIFETNDTGRRFVDALAAARDRGVRVLVLIDGIGELYSFPWAARLLRKRDCDLQTLR